MLTGADDGLPLGESSRVREALGWESIVDEPLFQMSFGERAALEGFLAQIRPTLAL